MTNLNSSARTATATALVALGVLLIGGSSALAAAAPPVVAPAPGDPEPSGDDDGTGHSERIASAPDRQLVWPRREASQAARLQGQVSDRVESHQPVSGQAAIDRLKAGAPLDLTLLPPEPAVDRDDVIALLEQDPSLFLVDGQLMYIEDAHPDTSPAQVQPPSDVSAQDLDEAFTLHSRPGSQKKIYLDFDGHITPNFSTAGRIDSAPYDLDGDPSSFNAAERAQIVRWWSQTAADFDTWDVDVTTEEPPISYLTRSDPSDSTFGVRVVVSPTSFVGNAAGVSLVGVFRAKNDVPAFVFTEGTKRGPDYLHLAMSHEVGHTLGLGHDGIDDQEYYGGHNDWMPIMGGADLRPIMQWSKGEYDGANRKQDDRAIIESVLGLVPDPYPSAPVPIAANTATTGVIVSASDTDGFRFHAAAGPVTVSARPTRLSTELDLGLTVVGPSFPAGRFSNVRGVGPETFSFEAEPGQYVVTVDGVGTGDPSTGYSDYSSVGEYEIVVTYAAVSGASQPDAIDFDGDGASDVFFVEPSDGRYQWRYSAGGSMLVIDLAIGDEPLDRLRFGDFDGDGRTDVFAVTERDGQYQWRYSSGGVSEWRNLLVGDEPIDELRFGDFDGDGKTDVFSVARNGSKGQWRYSAGGASSWRNLASAGQSLDQLRFGDFDGDGKTDVFAASANGATNQWLYSSGGRSRWRELFSSDAPLERLRFGDFDGDGRTDVFTTSAVGRSNQWKYSSGGVADWKNLARAGQPLESLRFGDFDADGRTDVFTVANPRPNQQGPSYQWLYSAAGAARWQLLGDLAQTLDRLSFGDIASG